MEKYYYRKRLSAAALMVLGALTLTGCGERDYEGVGDEYLVRGPVHSVEDDGTIHINEKQLQVVNAAGKAVKWFKNGKGQDLFSDEFNFDPDYNREGDGFWGACEEETTVGHVYGPDSTEEIAPTDLQPGTMVEIEGSIREETERRRSGNSTICGSEDKSVFTVVRVLPG